MKIFIYSNLNNVGYIIGKYLIKLGHDVLLIIDDNKPNTYVENYDPNINKTAYPDWIQKIEFKRPFLLRFFQNNFKKNNILAFLKTADLMLASEKGIVFGHYFKIPTIFIAHGRDIEIFNKKIIKYEISFLIKKKKFYQLIVQLFSFTYEVWFLKNATKKIVNIIYNPFPTTMSGQEAIKMLGLKKRHVYLPYPIEIPEIYRTREKVNSDCPIRIFWPTRHIWNATKKSNIHKSKANDIFIKGIAEFLKKHRSNIKIIIVRHGFNFEDSLQLIKKLNLDKYFEIINPTTRFGIIERIGKSDIIVDQFYEGILGLIGIEAMAFSKPVIGYVSQKIMKEHFGEKMPIVNIKHYKELPENLEFLMIKKNREKIGTLSRNYVEKHFSVESVVPKILDLKREYDKSNSCVKIS